MTGSNFSDRDLANLREYAPDVLERLGVTDLTRSFKCPNPSHDDSTPSAHYYENTNTVYCYGQCSRNFDAFDLVGFLTGTDKFPDKVRELADMVGYPLDGDARPMRRAPKRAARRKPAEPFPKPKPVADADFTDVCFEAFQRLYTTEGDIGRRYLRWRGLDDTDISYHGLGFMADPSPLGIKTYEPHALGYVIIPFWDERGVATYAMARTICKPGKANHKEWRPAGTYSPLWREWMLTTAQEVVAVTEGPIDAMALRKLTGTPCMALGGTNYAGRLASVLWYTPEDKRPGRIIICMDQDEAGTKASKQIARDLCTIGVDHITAPPYPDGHGDADEWLMAALNSGEFVDVRDGDGTGMHEYARAAREVPIYE